MLDSIRSFLIPHSFSSDTFARGLDSHSDEAMTAAAADFDMHPVTDVTLGISNLFSAGILVGIYALIRLCKSSLKAHAFAQLAPAVASQVPVAISDGKYTISFHKAPFGNVEIKDLDEKELNEAGLNNVVSGSGSGDSESGSNTPVKAILITIDGVPTIKRGINVLEMQERLRSDAFKDKSVYEQFLVHVTDLDKAIELYKTGLGKKLTDATPKLNDDLARLRIAVVLEPIKNTGTENEISFTKEPYGQVSIRDLSASECLQRHLSGTAILISIDGVETIKVETNVAELQKEVHEHIFNKNSGYKKCLGVRDNDIDLNQTELLYRIDKINSGQKWEVSSDLKKFSLTGCLKKINAKDANENDLKIFNYIFNLKLTLDELNAIPQLSDQEIESLASMAGSTHLTWKPDARVHCFYMLTEVSDNLLEVYKLIFTGPVEKKACDLNKYNPLDCLRKIGTKEFKQTHLQKFANFFGLNSNDLNLQAFTSLTKLSADQINFLMSLATHPAHLDGWDRNNTDDLLRIVRVGLSDNLLGVYKLIFAQPIADRLVLVKSESLAGCLGKIGTDNFGTNELKKFEEFFNLSNLNLADFKKLPKLAAHEVAFIVSMVAHPAHIDGWNPDNTDHLLGMVQIGLSNSLLGVFKVIFTDETLKKSVSLANEIHAVDMNFPDRSPDATAEVTLYDGTKVLLNNYGKSSKDGYMQITMDGETEKLHGTFINHLQDVIVKNKTNDGQNYSHTLPVMLDKKILDGANSVLTRMLKDSNSADHTRTKTNQVQIDADWGRNSYNRLVQFEIKGSNELGETSKISKPIKICDLLTPEGELKEGVQLEEGIQLDDRRRNLIYLSVHQMITGNFGGAVVSSVKSLTVANSQITPSKNQGEQQYVMTFPADFDDTHRVLTKSSSPVGFDFYDWGAETVFGNDFYDQLGTRDFLETTNLGIESAAFTAMHKRVPDEDSF